MATGRQATGWCAFSLLALYIFFNAERVRYVRWCMSSPFTCWGTSRLSGRPALQLSSPRALLVIGAPSSGTTQMARELTLLGLEIGHEVSDPIGAVCRDGTVSWVHAALRYAAFRSEEEREMTVLKLCSRPRPSCYNAAMIDGGRFGGGLKCIVRGNPPWDLCWQNECLRVTRRELGCAASSLAAASADGELGGDASSPSVDTGNCTTPFERAVVQVRHPIRWIESAVSHFCQGRDDAVSARSTIMLDTLSLLFPEVSQYVHLPMGSAMDNRSSSNGSTGKAHVRSAAAKDGLARLMHVRAQKVLRSKARGRPSPISHFAG